MFPDLPLEPVAFHVKQQLTVYGIPLFLIQAGCQSTSACSCEELGFLQCVVGLASHRANTCRTWFQGLEFGVCWCLSLGLLCYAKSWELLPDSCMFTSKFL